MKETKAVETKKENPCDLCSGEFMFICDTMYFHLPDSYHHKTENTQLIGSIDNTWKITRNSDNTITVSPSIRMSDGTGELWHGFLRNNLWQEI